MTNYIPYDSVERIEQYDAKRLSVGDYIIFKDDRMERVDDIVEQNAHLVYHLKNGTKVAKYYKRAEMDSLIKDRDEVLAYFNYFTISY